MYTRRPGTKQIFRVCFRKPNIVIEEVFVFCFGWSFIFLVLFDRCYVVVLFFVLVLFLSFLIGLLGILYIWFRFVLRIGGFRFYDHRGGSCSAPTRLRLFNLGGWGGLPVSFRNRRNVVGWWMLCVVSQGLRGGNRGIGVVYEVGC